MDNNKPNKDTIKEMLNGHKKKFNLVAVVIGIAVVIIIGLGAFYVVHTLNSTPKSYTDQNLNKIVENENNQAAAVNTNEQKPEAQSNNQNKEAVQKQAQNNVNNQNKETAQTKVYSVSSNIENNAKSAPSNQVGKVANSTVREGKTSKETSGPQIVNPYMPKTTNSGTSTAKLSTKKSEKSSKVNKAVVNRMVSKHTHRYKRHKHAAHKQYVLQVSSNLNKVIVTSTLKKLKKCGYKTFIRVKILNGKVYRRIMVGPISSYISARDEAKLIKKQLKLKYTPIIKKYDKVP